MNNNSLEVLIGVILFLIILTIIIKDIKKFKIVRNKSVVKILIYFLSISILYSLGEYVRGNKTLQDYIDKKEVYVIDGKIKNLKVTMGKGGGIKSFYINNKYFEIDIDKGFESANPFFKEDFYKKDKAIKHNGQHIKIEYIKVPAGKICTPFFKYCKYSKEIKNKIIKLWIYDK